MKKNVILLGAMMFSSFALAQIGINTPTPTSTLDVTAKNATGTSTNVDGLLVPRVTRERAQSMTTANIPTSTLIFVDNATSGTQTGNAINIDATGYYYFEGAPTNAWVKLKTPAAAPAANVNIYNADGTLTGNRIVTQGTNTLAFNTDSVNGFAVSKPNVGYILSVDGNNSRVGIGTAAPQHRLDLGTNFGASTTDVAGKKLAVYGDAAGNDFYGLGISAGILQFHAASAAAAAPGMVLTNTGNVGIGTSAPTNKLHVVATANPLRLEGVQASASSNDKALVIDATGVVKTALDDQSQFVGHMTTDRAISSENGAITKIISQTELIDKGNEYNTTTGLFTPLVSGIYEYEIEVTVNAPAAPTTYGEIGGSARGVIGFVNNATNLWVGRFNFQNSRDDRSTYAKGVANLVAGQSYYYGIGLSGIAGTVVANPTGATGSGIGTYFSIKRIQ